MLSNIYIRKPLISYCKGFYLFIYLYPKLLLALLCCLVMDPISCAHSPDSQVSKCTLPGLCRDTHSMHRIKTKHQ